jgi:ABC-2 type transport system permease protein
VAATRAISARAFADARVRTISFGLLFAIAALVQAIAYRDGYPTLEDRERFARTVADNSATRLLYGVPHDLLTVGGYVSWRVGGSLAVFAGLWGLLGAVRAMRAEEDAGRAELVLAGTVSRRRLFLAQLAAIAAGAAVLWLVTFVALLAGELPAGGSAYLALAIVASVPVFAGVGALASQLAPTKRLATALSTAVLAIAFLVRAIADSSPDTIGWLRWASPLGWAEKLRPFADPQPLVLILPALVSVLLLVAAGMLAARRDIGRGLLPDRDTSPPRLRLLGSPTAQALRSERGILIAWLLGVGAYGLLMGILADAVTPDVLSDEVQRQLEKYGTASIVTPSGWLGFAFLFVVLAISLFCCTQVASTRGEEAEQRLETLLARPVSRRGWLGGRLLLAAGCAAAVALATGVLTWVGAATQGAGVSLTDLLQAAANTLPGALLFLGVGALAFAVVPRASTALTYGLVAVTFLWEMLGALLDVPGWLLALSPFHDIGLVPAEPFDATAAAGMLAVATLAALGALWAFQRRDVTGI